MFALEIANIGTNYNRLLFNIFEVGVVHWLHPMLRPFARSLHGVTYVLPFRGNRLFEANSHIYKLVTHPKLVLFDDNLLALVQVDALGGGLGVQSAATDGVPTVVDVALT